jgi:hypothetical protein
MHMQAAALLLLYGEGRGGARGVLQLLMAVHLSRLAEGPVPCWCSWGKGQTAPSSHRRSTVHIWGVTTGRVCVALLHSPACCYWGWLGLGSHAASYQVQFTRGVDACARDGGG